jgi:hypothetical protein
MGSFYHKAKDIMTSKNNDEDKMTSSSLVYHRIWP